MAEEKSLPLRVRQAIRDTYDAPASQIEQKVNTICSTLGQRVIVEPQWPILWQMLRPSFREEKGFPMAVTRMVSSFGDIFIEFLNRSDCEEKFEKLLAELVGKPALRVLLIASTDEHERSPRLGWRAREAHMILSVPLTSEVLPAPRLAQVLRSDFEAILSGETPASKKRDQSENMIHVAEQDQWSVITQDQAEQLPDIDSIDSPERLMSRPPYFLQIEHFSKTISITSGHEGSLLLIESYLKRWSRSSDTHAYPNNELVKLRLHEASFGQRPAYEMLEIEAVRSNYVSPALVLAFVQNVLQYKPVVPAPSSRGWQFVRERPFV